MWYSEIINKKDGLESILCLFKNEREFINHYFSSVLFFDTKSVSIQANKIKENIKNNEKIPVRFSTKAKAHFYFHKNNNLNKKHSKNFKNRKEARIFAEANDLFHNESNIKVLTDKDGNYYVRKEIFNYTGYRVSQGAISDYKNYTISHVWGNTSNPYFFTSLWNISLIPQTFSFILDKSKNNSSLVKKIQIITEILHQKLYCINSIFKCAFDFEEDYSKYKDETIIVEDLIKNNIINFIKPKEDEISEPKLDLYDINVKFDKKLKNKDFIFKFLENLKDIGFSDFISLTDNEKVKEICKLSYPLLVDVTGDTNEIIHAKSRPVNSDVYYKTPFFEWKNKKFIICNDLKKKNRKMLIKWLYGSNLN